MKHPIPAAMILLAASGAACAENYSDWKLLTNPFPSTGGGGVMIHDYTPRVTGKTCITDFSARSGTDRFEGAVEFDAVETQGGVLCTNGRWTMKDGSNSGTTPFRVFLKDGTARGDPL